MKFCKDCKHYKYVVNILEKPANFSIPGNCLHPNNASRVDGSPHYDVEHLRYGFLNGCGEDGRWWEPKSE